MKGGRRSTGKAVVWGETVGVRKSCRVALAELTPHSPEQSKQVGRRVEPAPRKEEEIHC